MERRDCQLGDLGGIAKAAVRDDAGDAPLHQPRHQDRAGRGRAGVLAAVDDHHRAGRALLHRLALRVVAVLEHRDRVQVLARRDVAQREGLAHHVGQAGIQRAHVLDEGVAQAALEQRGGQGCGGNILQPRQGFGLHQ